MHIEGDVVLLGEVPEAGVGKVECHIEERDSPLVDLNGDPEAVGFEDVGDLLLDGLVLLGILGADLQAIVTVEAEGDRRAQDGFTFVSLMVERFLVVSFPGLPVSGAAANIGLHLLNPVRPGLHHRGLVNQVLVKAVALERAGAALPGGPGAGAVLHLLLGHAVGQHILVVSVDHLFHVGAGGVGIPIVQNFKSIYAEPVPVSSQFAENISLRIRTF